LVRKKNEKKKERERDSSHLGPTRITGKVVFLIFSFSCAINNHWHHLIHNPTVCSCSSIMIEVRNIWRRWPSWVPHLSHLKSLERSMNDIPIIGEFPPRNTNSNFKASQRGFGGRLSIGIQEFKM
jgi:hypothetical protein